VAGDEKALADALRRFGEDENVDPSLFLSTPGAVIFLAEEDGMPVGRAYGHGLAHPDGETTMLLYAIDVVPGARRRGHGRRLVNAFVEHARAAGHTEVWVLSDENNPAGMALYAAAGARRDETNQVLFTWRLGPGRHSSHA
jgi:GNAT superfamily N-acetyltransferase